MHLWNGAGNRPRGVAPPTLSPAPAGVIAVGADLAGAPTVHDVPGRFTLVSHGERQLIGCLWAGGMPLGEPRGARAPCWVGRGAFAGAAGALGIDGGSQNFGKIKKKKLKKKVFSQTLLGLLF